jgi:hypothetical protein
VHIFRRRGPAQLLLEAAGTVATGSDLEIAQAVAYEALRRDRGTAGDVMARAEDLLTAEKNYSLVMSVLECAQNLSSHRQPEFLATHEAAVLLGPRGTICWNAIADFWQRVAAWATANDVLSEPKDILSVENTQLRTMLWTTNRTFPGGGRLGLAEALRYERAGGRPLPAFGHIAANLDSVLTSLPTTTAYLPGADRGTCPVCGEPATQDARYPRALCLPCTDSAVCQTHSLPARLGGPGSLSGGFVPGHVSIDGSWEACEGIVTVNGRQCVMEEARFGGTVVQPVEPAS